MKKYYETRNAFPHVVNGLKYCSSILSFIIGFYNPLGSDRFYISIGFYIFSTTFSLVWDIIMDWGLLRTKEPGKYGL